jgi:probable HAF family extracellular repeat protein
VGRSFVGATQYAVEWSGGGVINLGGLPGAASSVADGINDSGQVVGSSVIGGTEYAVEWSGGTLVKLEDLSGSADSVAAAINDAGVVVGESGGYATEWSGGRVINLGRLPGSSLSEAESINTGQVVGFSVVGGVTYATEWSGGSVINLGGLPGATFSSAESINSFGQIVGESDGSTVVPETSDLGDDAVWLRRLRFRPLSSSKSRPFVDTLLSSNAHFAIAFVAQGGVKFACNSFEIRVLRAQWFT